MSNLVIVEPFALTDAQIAVTRGTSKALLLDPERKHVFFDTVDGAVLNIDIDLSATTSWDSVSLVGLNSAAATTWRVLGGASLTQNVYMASRDIIDAEALGPPYNAALFNSAAVLSGRYVRIEITRPAAIGTLTLGCLVVGKCFRPTWNIEIDGGDGPLDTGIGQTRPDGGHQARPGVRVPERSFTLGDLSDAELRQLRAIVYRRGEHIPLLIAEDPDFVAGATDRIGWGVFTNLERFSRRDPGKHRFALTFRDWL